MSRVTQALKEETRRCIIVEAQSLFIEHGFDKTKTKVIAKNCGLAEGTLFNYFKTKDELLIAVFEAMAENEQNEIEQAKFQPKDYLIESALLPLKRMRKFPKGILSDLLLTTLKFARKKPKLFHKLVKLDFKYINDLTLKLNKFITFDDEIISANELAEMIYGIVATEFIMFLYDDTSAYKDFEVKAIKKLNVLIKPHLGGNRNDHTR